MAEKKETIGAIYGQMVEVMKAIGAVGKTQENSYDKYKFRGIDDVYNALGPAMQEVGIFVTPRVFHTETKERQSSKGKAQLHITVGVEYTFFSGSDGSNVQAVVHGEGMDRGDKALNKAMSAAFKNAIFQTFAIPTGEKSDSENESPEIAPKEGTSEPKKAAPKKRHPSPIEELRYDGLIEDVQVIDGRSNGKDWRKYALTCGRHEIATFNANDGKEAIRCCDGQIPIALTFTMRGKYKNLASLVPMVEADEEQLQREEEPPPHDDSDVPF